MSYKLFTDKQEIFECKITLEGASLTQATSRIIVETQDLKLMFEGTIDKDGTVEVLLSYLALEVTYTEAVGYGNNVIGVASGDISKINGIATADISKVNGV